MASVDRSMNQRHEGSFIVCAIVAENCAENEKLRRCLTTTSGCGYQRVDFLDCASTTAMVTMFTISRTELPNWRM